MQNHSRVGVINTRGEDDLYMQQLPDSLKDFIRYHATRPIAAKDVYNRFQHVGEQHTLNDLINDRIRDTTRVYGSGHPDRYVDGSV